MFSKFVYTDTIHLGSLFEMYRVCVRNSQSTWTKQCNVTDVFA